MRRTAWPMAALLFLLTAGCGGGGSTASPGSGGGGGPTLPDRIPFEPVAAVKLDVDVTTGKVTVTPIKPEGGDRAIWAGDKIEVQSSDLLASDGSTPSRSLNLRLRNNTGQPLGATGVRVQFRNLAFGDQQDFRPNVRVSTAAGTGVNGSTDGPALSNATTPYAVQYLPDGALLILEPLGLRVLRNGMLSTVATTAFTLSGGLAVVVDPATQKTFALVADTNAHRIKWVDILTGAGGSLAGTGVAGDVAGAPATAQFNLPRGLAWDGTGLFIADSGNGKIKRTGVTFAAGVPVAATVTTPYSGIATPSAVAFSQGQLAVAEQGASKVRIYRTGVMFFGSGVAGYQAGNAVTARFNQPCGLAWAGNVLYVANSGTGSIMGIWRNPDAEPNDPDSYSVALIAGTGVAGNANGLGNIARFNTLATGMAARGSSLYVADRGNARLRLVESLGPTLDAGLGQFANSGSLLRVTNATGNIDATANRPGVPFIARSSSLPAGQWADFGRVDFQIEGGAKRFTMTLMVEADSGIQAGLDTVSQAGTGEGSPSNYVQGLLRVSVITVDGALGQASSALGLLDFDADAEGNLYMAEDNVVRRFDVRMQKVTTIAGSLTAEPGTVDDLGVAARFETMNSISVTGSGNLMLIAQGNHVIRAVLYDGAGDRNHHGSYLVRTVIGSPGLSGEIEGSGANVRLTSPRSVGISSDGKLGVFAYSAAARVMLIRLSGDPTSSSSYHISSIPTSAGTSIVATDIDSSGRLAYSRTIDADSQPAIEIFSIPQWLTAPMVNGGAVDSDTTRTAFGANAMAIDNDGRIWFASQGQAGFGKFRIRRHNQLGVSTAVSGAALGLTEGVGNQIAIPAAVGVKPVIAVSDEGTVYFYPGGYGFIYRISRIVR